ncbi:RNA polymerase subunit sigma [Pandoraea anapnoica]|uniref:RNA polymerase subunit sigma n=1 Tax=Pandoraea anapnoica TaxID=2508301 RepID=A0A5E4ZY93_9BURK|nr:sigma-70 family RNA polymerase sigma factor [Pandoraea anapnoica]VVE65263.1 RNA polymerase subunit sigma [Pandoraea anapnoica]
MPGHAAERFHEVPVHEQTDEFDYESLIAACHRQDAEALRQLYERDAAYLLGVAHRIVRDRQLAEDVLHDAFVSVWTRAATFDAARGSGRGWIFSIVRHQALNTVRRRNKEVDMEEDSFDAHMNGTTTAATDSFSLDADPMMRGRLAQCLERLDAPGRASILYAYLDGCSHSEIAQRLRSPLGTVKAWVRRGLQSLRECME